MAPSPAALPQALGRPHPAAPRPREAPPPQLLPPGRAPGRGGGGWPPKGKAWPAWVGHSTANPLVSPGGGGGAAAAARPGGRGAAARAAAALLTGAGAWPLLGRRRSGGGGRRLRAPARRGSTCRQAVSDTAASAVDTWVADNKIVVFSKTWCPYCTNAKEALASVGAEFAVVELDERDDEDEVQDALEAKTGARTVPRVFIGGKCIGGGDETAELLESGELKELVSAVAEPKLVELDAEALQATRPAQWVLRSSDLQKSLAFLTSVCGMTVLRHEEREAPCEVGGSGRSEGPWSRTVVGYGAEDGAFCLELTYSYGVAAYPPGTGLAHIALSAEEPEEMLEVASKLGYKVEGDIITGPDEYRFRVLPGPPRRKERFLYVALQVPELPKAVEFYGAVLGMNDLTWDFEHFAFNRGGSELMRVVGYSAEEEVPLMLYEEPGSEVKLEQWEGRALFAMPEGALRGAYARLQEVYGTSGIVHSLREAEMGQLGKLLVAVVRDAAGYELCWVGSEGFDAAVAAFAAAGPPEEVVDWGYREAVSSKG